MSQPTDHIVYWLNATMGTGWPSEYVAWRERKLKEYREGLDLEPGKAMTIEQKLGFSLWLEGSEVSS